MALLVLGYSFLILFLSAFTLFLLGRSLDIALGFTPSLVFMPLIVLLTILPISIAGWGVREVSMVMQLEQVGVSCTDAVALSVAFGLALLVTCLPGGVLWTFDSQLKHHTGNSSNERLLRQDPAGWSRITRCRPNYQFLLGSPLGRRRAANCSAASLRSVRIGSAITGNFTTRTAPASVSWRRKVCTSRSSVAALGSCWTPLWGSI
jgi:hypothetical protein